MNSVLVVPVQCQIYRRTPIRILRNFPLMKLTGMPPISGEAKNNYKGTLWDSCSHSIICFHQGVKLTVLHGYVLCMDMWISASHVVCPVPVTSKLWTDASCHVYARGNFSLIKLHILWANENTGKLLFTFGAYVMVALSYYGSSRLCSKLLILTGTTLVR